MSKRELDAERKSECLRLKEIFNAKKRELGLTQEKLAHALGMNQSSVSHYLNGINPLNTAVAASFAKLLEIPISDFSERLAREIDELIELGTALITDGSRQRPAEWGSPITNVEAALQPTRSFSYPEISWVQAGNVREAVDMGSVAMCPQHTSDVWAGENAFWLRVVGNSMSSSSGTSFPEGFLILVAPDIEPRAGQFVVARMTDTNEATFKQLVRDAGELYLKPINPAYPTKAMDDTWEIVGTVVDGKMPKSVFL